MKIWGPTPEIVMTHGAQVIFQEADRVERYLNRHFSSDWGEVGKEDWKQNDQMLKEEGMILSAYTTLAGWKIWIITDPGHEVTTVLTPDEY